MNETNQTETKQRVNFTLDPDAILKLAALSAHHRRSASNMVNQLIIEAHDKWGKEKTR